MFWDARHERKTQIDLRVHGSASPLITCAFRVRWLASTNSIQAQTQFVIPAPTRLLCEKHSRRPAVTARRLFTQNYCATTVHPHFHHGPPSITRFTQLSESRRREESENAPKFWKAIHAPSVESPVFYCWATALRNRVVYYVDLLLT